MVPDPTRWNPKDPKMGSKVSIDQQAVGGIPISHKRVSQALACGVVLMCAVFGVGYFLGEHRAVERFVQRLETHSLEDYLLASIGDIVAPQQQEGIQTPARYQAQFAGFGSHEGAAALAARLMEQGVEATVQKRTGVSTEGITRTWYQVVTAESCDRCQLEQLVQKLSQHEQIRGARIVVC